MLPDRKDGEESPKSLKDVFSRQDRAHVILVRTLLHQLLDKLPDESAKFPSGRVLFRCVLTSEDLSILKRYASYAEVSRPPSADAVNEIFSRFLEPVLGDEEDSSYTYFFYFAVALSAIPALFFCLRTLNVFQLTFVTVVVFAGYELYISAIAKQHSLMSKQPSIPEECLPSSQQSIYTRIMQFFSRRSSDYCDEYFKLLMTHPVTELRPDRIAYTIFGEAVVRLFKTLGVSLGSFYEKVNNFVPFYFALPLTIAFLYLFFRFTFLSAGMTGPIKSKKKRKITVGKPMSQLPAKS
uniref:Chloride channel CLIC-like protein 1 n=1 Tax=Schistocephalus solidus TaxID=70667 RepID=A0A0X3P541_SCHSO